MKKICTCGVEILSQKRDAKYCSSACKYKYRIRPSGLTYKISQVNKSWYKKGSTPWTRGKKLENHAWNKGFGLGYVNVHGYRVVGVGSKEILEHRFVVQQLLGRELTSCEIVHHKNHNKIDNRPENLEVMSRSEHISLHNAERKILV